MSKIADKIAREASLNAAATNVYNAAVQNTREPADMLAVLSLAYAFACKTLGVDLARAKGGVDLTWDAVDPAAAVWEGEEN